MLIVLWTKHVIQHLFSRIHAAGVAAWNRSSAQRHVSAWNRVGGLSDSQTKSRDSKTNGSFVIIFMRKIVTVTEWVVVFLSSFSYFFAWNNFGDSIHVWLALNPEKNRNMSNEYNVIDLFAGKCVDKLALCQWFSLLKNWCAICWMKRPALKLILIWIPNLIYSWIFLFEYHVKFTIPSKATLHEEFEVYLYQHYRVYLGGIPHNLDAHRINPRRWLRISRSSSGKHDK